MEEVLHLKDENQWACLQVVKPAVRPVPVDASLGLDVVVRWHREWDAQALNVPPQPREHARPH